MHFISRTYLLTLVILLQSLCAFAQKNCVPTFSRYFGQLDRVALNTIYQTQYVSNGYTFNTSLRTELLLGKSYDLSFISSDIGKYAAWIDYDNDSIFSSSELIFSDTIPTNETYGTIIIPKDSSCLGLRRLRILYIWDGILSPCGQYENGECRDYWVSIASVPSSQVHDYCIPSPCRTTPCEAPIDQFSIHKLNNQHSGCNNLGYTLYADTVFTTNLKIGYSYPVQISTGRLPANYAVWIDLNNDGLFALQEQLFHNYGSTVSGYIPIPNDSSSIGKRRLRVMSSWWKEQIDPCRSDSSHSTGEVEDYIIRITPECSPPPKPSIISGSNSMCNGSTQIYSIKHVPGAIYYKWVLPMGWMGYSKDTSITVITGNSEGLISVLAGDTCEESLPQTIIVKPIIDTSITENWGVLTSGTTDATYQWIRCETLLPIAGATSRNYTPVYNGAFAAIITKMGCTDTSACYEFWHVGEPEVLQDGYVTITPNPILNGKVIIVSQRKIDSIEIYNLIGERIYSRQDIEDPKTEIDLSGHTSGIYFFYAKSGDTISTKKIVKPTN